MGQVTQRTSAWKPFMMSETSLAPCSLIVLSSCSASLSNISFGICFASRLCSWLTDLPKSFCVLPVLPCVQRYESYLHEKIK
eukprot:COSAG02_NODE_152_length_33208_cov_13.316591_19_plen_82_part_00